MRSTAPIFAAPSTPIAQPAGFPSASIVLIVVLLLTLLHLRYPLHEDQALFMYAAREMADGALMYREFWDMKQPGIYWWYLAVGSLFGFDAYGLRWMDVLWSLATAGILWAALRQRGALTAVLAPCLAFLCFYGRASTNHFSQVEWLIGGPIAVVLWCVGTEFAAGTARRYALAGAMVAIVAVFKSMAALLPIAMIAVALAHARWGTGIAFSTLFKQRALPALGGFALVVLLVAGWMASNGTLREALWTAFVYPGIAVREYEHSPLPRLLWSARWFAVGAVALLPWALWAVYNGARRGLRIELICTAWAAAALVIIGMQVLSFWEYHFDLLFLPVGVLAALGFVDVLTRFSTPSASAAISAPSARPGRTYRSAAIAVLVLGVALSIGWPLARKTGKVIAAMPFTPERQAAFDATLDDRWADFKASADAVKRYAKPGDRIVVWGDARLHFMVERRPYVEINGSTFYTAQQTQQVAAFIRQHKPALVYMSKHRERMTNLGDRVLPRTVAELYVPAHEDRLGIWYRLNDAQPAGGANSASAAASPNAWTASKPATATN